MTPEEIQKRKKRDDDLLLLLIGMTDDGMARTLPSGDEITAAAQQYFADQRSRAIAAVTAGRSLPTFNTPENVAAAVDAIAPAMQQIAADQGNAILNKVGALQTVRDEFESKVEHAMRDAAASTIATINATTDAQLSALPDGPDVVDGVGGIFDNASGFRAALIGDLGAVKATAVGETLAATLTGEIDGKGCLPQPTACPICKDNAAQGVIPLDESFESGDQSTPFHDGCRCSMYFRLKQPMDKPISASSARLAKCPACGSFDVTRKPGDARGGPVDKCDHCGATWPHKPGTIPAARLRLADDAGGHWVPLDEGQHVLLKDPVGDGKGFSRAGIERKLIKHHEDVTGESASSVSVAEQQAFDKSGRGFAQTKIDAAKQTAMDSNDPEMRFTAMIHDHLPGGRGSVDSVDASKLKVGHEFTFGGVPFKVAQDDDGYKVIAGGGSEFNADALEKVPVDRGSLRMVKSKVNPDDLRFADMRAFIFEGPPDAFQPIDGESSWPTKIHDQPVKYFAKHSLPVGDFVDSEGVRHHVPPERIDRLIANFHKLKAKGKLPCSVDSHVKKGATTYGPIIDARKRPDGDLELIHQHIGDDAIKAAARNGSSIGTITGYVDSDGVVYDEVIDHNATIPDPRIYKLDGFAPVEIPSTVQSAIAASGPAIPAVHLRLAASETTETAMADFKKLRKAMDAPDTAKDDELPDMAADHIAGLKKRAEAAESKSMKMSESMPRTIDPEIVSDRAIVFSDKLELLVQQGKCTPAQRDAAIKFASPDDKPMPLVFSESVNKGPTGLILKLLELNDGVNFGVKTGAQPVPRQTPGATSGDDLKEAADSAAAYQKAQLAARGLT